MSRRPNIILTIADDQRGTALGCAGIEPVLTPCLNRLAARGTRFTHAQHLGGPHGGLCAPSRAMLHTGVPYFQLDQSLMGGTYPPKDRTPTIPPMLGEKLRGAGYHTFATGKWHNGTAAFAKSFDHAANIFFGGMADHWFTPVHTFDPTGEYPADAATTADGFSTDVFAQSAIDFIRSRRGSDQPFFCYVAFTAPHDPRTPPDAWRRRYDPRQMPLPPNIQPQHFAEHRMAPKGVTPPAAFGPEQERDELLLGVPRDVREIERSIAEYYGMVSHMDEQIGRIHAAVEAIGEAENTIIIHTADHGLAVGQHGLLGKQNLYQHSLRVPLLMAGPGVPVGQSDALVYQHDLHATLAAMTGAASASGVFQNLLPIARGDTRPRECICAAFRDRFRSVRDERHKLVELNVDGKRSAQLFDLASDPWETKNLIDDASLAGKVAGLRSALKQWQQQTGDQSSAF